MWAHELLRQGGAWLGAARSWLQHKRTTKGVHGDQITWGDANALFVLSARDVEEVAAEAAAAVFNQEQKKSEPGNDLLGRIVHELRFGEGDIALRVDRTVVMILKFQSKDQ
jgi:hypothetical protein